MLRHWYGNGSSFESKKGTVIGPHATANSWRCLDFSLILGVNADDWCCRTNFELQPQYFPLKLINEQARYISLPNSELRWWSRRTNYTPNWLVDELLYSVQMPCALFLQLHLMTDHFSGHANLKLNIWHIADVVPKTMVDGAMRVHIWTFKSWTWLALWKAVLTEHTSKYHNTPLACVDLKK